MRAMVFRGADKPLALETIDDPTPGEAEVVLKVGRCGICGTDLHRTEKNLITHQEGAVLGHEFSGEVVAIGKNVTTLSVGDKVTALPYLGCNTCIYCVSGSPHFCALATNIGDIMQRGAFAEYVIAGAPFTIKLPDGLSLADGALIEPVATALRGVMRADLKPGQKVLVLGAGPIGLAVAYWAKRAAAGKVVVQASSKRRAEFADKMGADKFVAPEEGVRPEQTAGAALGGLADVVFECVGSPGLIDQAIRSVRVGGVVVVLGACAHRDQWTPIAGLVKEIDLRFSMVYNINEYHVAIDAMDAGDFTLRALVSETVDLEHTAEAFEALRGPSHRCKVLVAPWGD
jgi:(R,R)-butanediol dehydrogenase/meso-butanediol dehydrogenase/diacetyl reductase